MAQPAHSASSLYQACIHAVGVDCCKQTTVEYRDIVVHISECCDNITDQCCRCDTILLLLLLLLDRAELNTPLGKEPGQQNDVCRERALKLRQLVGHDPLAGLAGNLVCQIARQ